VLALPAVLGSGYHLRLAALAAIYATLALALNLVVGYAGQLDLGFVAFFGTGAYASAVLGSPLHGLRLPFPVLVAAGGGLAAVLALALGIPTLRLRGDYLAIVTLGFGQVFQLLLYNLDRPFNLTNGARGITGLYRPHFWGWELGEVRHVYCLAVLLAGAVYTASVRLRHTRVGRNLLALGEDSVAAAACGIPVPGWRLSAFVCGAVVAGLAGVVFASWQGAVFPENFGLSEVIAVYCMLVLGGVGQPAGVVGAALLLVVLPELMRTLVSFRMLAYGAILLLAVRYRPPRLLLPARAVGPPLPALSLQATAFPRRTGVLLEVVAVSKRYGGVQALDGVSFSVRAGEVVSIIGPNGAGKTTLIDVISGVVAPTSGSVRLAGTGVDSWSPWRRARLGLARTFQHGRVFSRLSALENVLVGAGGGRTAADRAHSLLRELAPGLDADAPASGLAYADRRRLEVVRALASNPTLVLLDEPAAGMSPEEATDLALDIRGLQARGLTVVLVEHRMPVVMAASDRVIVLDQGRVIASGTPAEVAADERVIAAYLGRPAPLSPPPAAPRAPVLLAVDGLAAGYQGQAVLRNLNLEVREGEVVCILGGNAAGKTTLVKTIIGLLPPLAGKVRVAGKPLSSGRPGAAVRAGLAVVPEGRRVFGRLTVMENLQLGAAARSQLDGERLREVWDLFPRLHERRRQRAGDLSGGEQQMLAIARALMARPRLLILDEPAMGLSPVLAHSVYQAVARINAAGTAVLIAEQNAALALAVSHRGYVLTDGGCALEGTAAGLRADSSVRRAYLGH
jgi:ABC-type branched-subunit amino acid transport system ATPase component/ABC-type branched-subunit amino acid transport system permease subunit